MPSHKEQDFSSETWAKRIREVDDYGRQFYAEFRRGCGFINGIEQRNDGRTTVHTRSESLGCRSFHFQEHAALDFDYRGIDGFIVPEVWKRSPRLDFASVASKAEFTPSLGSASALKIPKRSGAVAMKQFRTLRVGMKGADVRALQQVLQVKADNYFGGMTEAALKNAQRKAGLVADGVCGPKSREMLGLDRAEQQRPDSVIRPMVVHRSLVEIDAVYDKGTWEWNQAAYLIMDFDKGFEKEVEKQARLVLSRKIEFYDVLETKRGIPWWLSGTIHKMECDCNRKGVLHNGEAIIGTNRKTKLVPAGKGPFKTWLEAALDAVDTQAGWESPSFDIGHALVLSERFNGGGYLKHHRLENSPYNWAQTTINDGTGKYVKDRVWSETASTNARCGVAAMIRWFELNGYAQVTYK